MKRTSRKSFNHRPLCPNSCLHFLETVSDSGESEYGSQEKYGCIILKLLCTKFHAFCYLVFSLFIIFWFSLLKLDNQWVIIGFIISITNILVFTLQFMFIALIESLNVFFLSCILVGSIILMFREEKMVLIYLGHVIPERIQFL